MTLRDYLDREVLTYAAFARSIGSQHARTVQRYAEGHQVPNPTMMRRIANVTDGAVTPNDFYGLGVAETDHANANTDPETIAAPGKCRDLAALHAEAQS